MGGGLMQLVAYGAQDIYLTGNPQITFFKVVYRRHTNFSMEHIQQTFSGTPGAGARVVATISRNGDLLHDCYLKVEVNEATAYVINPGHWIINNIEVNIGGQRIDRHYGQWMEAHAELTEKNLGVNEAELVNASYQIASDAKQTLTLSPFQLSAGAGGVRFSTGSLPNNLYVPLRFWFCRHVGLSLPLIALQYHEVNIIIEFNSTPYGIIKTTSTPELWANYIYLDTDERRRFAQVSHEYLIEQVQFQEISVSAAASLKLNFNHPVKELIWFGIDPAGGWDGNNGGGLGYTIPNTSTTVVQLKLNGHDRFAAQNIDYFTRYQPMKYHSGASVSSKLDSIAVYSFALKPEEHQPSGTCNFSRIDNAELVLEGDLNTCNLNIFAVNYNVLRIMSGMGGLAYSN